MNTQAFTIKRKNMSAFFFLAPLFLMAYPFIHNYVLGAVYPIADMKAIMLYAGLSFIFMGLLYPLFQFTVKATPAHLVVNKVSTVPYKDIQKAYIGTFSFIEAFEQVDSLPLAPFKDKRLESFFHKKKGNDLLSDVFLVLYTKKNLFFIKASYFHKESFSKLTQTLQEKNITIEEERITTKREAV